MIPLQKKRLGDVIEEEERAHLIWTHDECGRVKEWLSFLHEGGYVARYNFRKIKIKSSIILLPT